MNVPACTNVLLIMLLTKRSCAIARLLNVTVPLTNKLPPTLRSVPMLPDPAITKLFPVNTFAVIRSAPVIVPLIPVIEMLLVASSPRTLMLLVFNARLTLSQ